MAALPAGKKGGSLGGERGEDHGQASCESRSHTGIPEVQNGRQGSLQQPQEWLALIQDYPKDLANV